jgi:hypothetical protein
MARALERWEWGNEIEEFLQSLTSSENEIEEFLQSLTSSEPE